MSPKYGSLITQAAALLKFRTFEEGDKLDAELCEAAISLRHCADALRGQQSELDKLREDAERYRAIKSMSWSDMEQIKRGTGPALRYGGMTLDEAVDKHRVALAELKKSG